VRLCTYTFVSRHFVPTPDAQLCVCRCCRGHVPSGAHQVHWCVACVCDVSQKRIADAHLCCAAPQRSASAWTRTRC
jgi:hypothetical protein